MSDRGAETVITATAAVPTLAGLGGGIGWPDTTAATARDEAPAGAGRLVDLLEWLAAAQGTWPPHAPRRPRLLLLGTVGAAAAATADAVGAGVRQLDVPAEHGAALVAGGAAADDEAESGTDLLVVAGPDDSPAAGVLVGVLTGAEPVALLPRGAHAVDSAAWISAACRSRDARRRAAPLRDVPDDLLAAVGSPALSLITGLILRAAARRTPMVLDGTAAVAAALLCREFQARATRWCRLADSSPDPVHTRASGELGQRPLLDLGSTSSGGVAGLLCLPLLRAAAALAAGHTPAPPQVQP